MSGEQATQLMERPVTDLSLATGPMQKVGNQYATAMTVQRPREISRVEHSFLQEASLAGERFFYGWGSGKDKIEGASVDLAMALVRLWGNCAIEMQPVQETQDSWIFTAAFVDLETGFTLSRQFRQSKSWTVHGKYDEHRKEDIRFQIGQSKAIRNVVLNALPKWMADKGIEKAKENVVALVKKAIEQKSMAEVQRLSVDKLAKEGVTPDAILRKFGRSTIQALTVEDLVIMRGDAIALHEGRDTVEDLYPDVPSIEEKKSEESTGGGKSRTERAAQRTASSRKQTDQTPAEESSAQQSKPADPPAAQVGGKKGQQKSLGLGYPEYEDKCYDAKTQEEVQRLRYEVRNSGLDPDSIATLLEILVQTEQKLRDQGKWSDNL